MDELLDECLRRIDAGDVSADAVSKWSVHQQLEHVAFALHYFLDRIEAVQAGEGRPSGSPGLLARIIFLTGRIPRGRGKAPENAHPAPAPDPAHVREQLQSARERLHGLGSLGSKLRSQHPLLRGWFTAKQWFRFAVVHTRHHLRIVRDIGRAASRRGV